MKFDLPKTIDELVDAAQKRKAHTATIVLRDGDDVDRHCPHTNDFKAWLAERKIPYVPQRLDNVFHAALRIGKYASVQKLPYVHQLSWDR